MRVSRTVGGRARVAIAALVVVTGLAMAQPASATNTPPRAAGGLIGTWTNETTTPGTVLRKLVIRSDGAGGVTVDTFTTCGGPTLCENGRITAVVFGPEADSPVGRFFQTNQHFAAYNKVLLGRLIDTSDGQRISLQRYVAFTGGARHNSALNYQFKRVSTSTAGTTKNGTATTAYSTGLQPTPSTALLGTWHNTNAGTRGLAQLIVTPGSGNSLLVHAFGACTPSFCDIGTFTAITYGRLATSTTGARFLAPHDAGFKNELYIGQVLGDGTLKVTYYNEYTDSSGRSNFAISETFAH